MKEKVIMLSLSHTHTIVNSRMLFEYVVDYTFMLLHRYLFDFSNHL